MRPLRLLVIAAALLPALAPAMAASDEDTITRWFGLLVAANEDGLGELLSDDAIIKIEDLGVIRSKTEFLGTMSEWRIAIAGGGIRHKVEKSQGGVTTVLACYDFADNDILQRETFRIADGKITENTQARVADDCSAY